MLISDPTLRPYYLRAKDRYIILHFQSGLITSIRDEKGEKKEKLICILYHTTDMERVVPRRLEE